MLVRYTTEINIDKDSMLEMSIDDRWWRMSVLTGCHITWGEISIPLMTLFLRGKGALKNKV